MITQERLKELLHYNPDTGGFTWIKSTSNRVRVGGIAGSKRDNYRGKVYIVISVDKRSYKAHRLAWMYQNGKFPDDQIDHINGCGTDNRLVNLRCVDSSENHKNVRLRRDNTSGFTGVHFDQPTNKWRVRIGSDGVEEDLGVFDSLIDAVAARMGANRKYGFHENHGQSRPL